MELTDERNVEVFLMNQTSTGTHMGPGYYPHYGAFSKANVEKASSKTKPNGVSHQPAPF
jgi:hypothetical protein